MGVIATYFKTYNTYMKVYITRKSPCPEELIALLDWWQVASSLFYRQNTYQEPDFKCFGDVWGKSSKASVKDTQEKC